MPAPSIGKCVCGVKPHHPYSTFTHYCRQLQQKKSSNQDSRIENFPSGPVVENPLFNAGDTGSIPGQETKIPHTS